MPPTLRSLALLLVTLGLAAAAPYAQTATAPRPTLVAPAPLRITTPEQFFGHQIGADYVLPNYTQLTEYWQKLDARIGPDGGAEHRQDRRGPRPADGDHHRARELQEAGPLQGDRAPAGAGRRTHRRPGARARRGRQGGGLDRRRPARHRGAGRAAADGDSSTRWPAGTTTETHADPARRDHARRRTRTRTAWSWCPTGTCAKQDPTKRSTGDIPRLYQKYVGHDNNRDFYIDEPAGDRPTSAAMQYREWFPQIIYNHHQTGPTGTVLFAPPFRDPFNYNFDPLIPLGIDMVGAAMHSRFVAEGKPGATMRRGANYSTWWNGGLRTAVYFHNMIGLLTETIGNPTPMRDPASCRSVSCRPRRPAVPDRAAEVALPPVDRLLDHRQPRGARPRVALPRARSCSTSTGWAGTRSSGAAATPGRRHPKRMPRRCGPRSRRRRSPTRAEFNPAAAAGGRAHDRAGASTSTCCASRRCATRAATSSRPTRPTSSPPPSSSTRCIKIGHHGASRDGGVHRWAARPTRPGRTSSRRRRRSGRTSLDMFEPQDHPNDFQYPGGPPIPPVRQRRLDAGVPDGREVRPHPRRRSTGRSRESGCGDSRPPDRWTGAQARRATCSSHKVNDAFMAVNRLLKAGEEVYWLGRHVGARRLDGHRRDVHHRRSRRRAACCRRPRQESG